MTEKLAKYLQECMEFLDISPSTSPKIYMKEGYVCGEVVDNVGRTVLLPWFTKKELFDPIYTKTKLVARLGEQWNSLS